jgi:hypothetical protein
MALLRFWQTGQLRCGAHAGMSTVLPVCLLSLLVCAAELLLEARS